MNDRNDETVDAPLFEAEIDYETGMNYSFGRGVKKNKSQRFIGIKKPLSRDMPKLNLILEYAMHLAKV